MAKCIFTGEETLTKTKGYPVSRDGREVLREKQQLMAEVRLEEFKKMIEETNEKIVEKTNEQNAESGDVGVPNLLTPNYDIKDFMPSVKEVLVEQERQNKLNTTQE